LSTYDQWKRWANVAVVTHQQVGVNQTLDSGNDLCGVAKLGAQSIFAGIISRPQEDFGVEPIA
jgi:hypothetical protein